MKDVAHHLKYVQKKVIQSLRKVSNENPQNGTKIAAPSSKIESPTLSKRKPLVFK